MPSIEASCICHQGKVRAKNEDNFYFAGVYLKERNDGLPNIITISKDSSQIVCYGVFDGMGGEVYGEKAAYIAAKSFAGIMFSKKSGINVQWLEDACLKMNEEVCVESQKHDYVRMGSTVAIIGFEKEKAYICNLGDSKIFVFRDNSLEQLSYDHTDARVLKEYGIRNRKPSLTQHLGIYPSEMIIEPYCKEFEINSGDKYLLCSDGLTDMVSLNEIQKVLSESEILENTVLDLQKKALEYGGKDNITIILIEIK